MSVQYNSGAIQDGRRIAFRSNRGGDFEIYVMDADGSNPVNLTHHPARDVDPSWSPDGRQIIFTSDRSDDLEIYMMDADGGNPVNLTHHPANDEWASWSPAGSQIAFTSNRSGSNEVYVLDVAPTAPISLKPDQRSTVYQGETALQLQAGGKFWQVVYEAVEPLDLAGYTALHFAFHPGDIDLAEERWLQVGLGATVIDVLGGELAGGKIDPALRDWQVVELPLDLFDLDVRQPIEAITFNGNLFGTFYLDDIRLLTAAPSPPFTAVLEEHATSLPQSFALQQNYPNPFNSSTVFRFALPSDADVTLFLYNLTGQQVVTLVEGRRAAGTYTLHWDGRDDDGRALASGVYLYQLQAGTQVETRKLVLLR